MPSLREGITKTFRRLSRRTPSSSDPAIDDTLLATDPRQGKQYGSYRILRRLGAGGMGHVYLALDTRLGRHAALKFLSFELTADSSLFARLEQEARTASSLNHPNILTIYDIGQAHGEHYIASEFVDGVTLRAALDRRLVEPSNAIEIAMQIASALISAHAAGVVHRDLKPGNIMLRPDGFVKVIDFGLAKSDAGQPAGSVSEPGGIAGSVDYMSPEQARGDAVDSRTDLWSLGVVFYEMLAGKLPFSGETDSHVIVAILDRPTPPLPQEASFPRGTGAVVTRALLKDRNKRYQSARDLLADVEALRQPSRQPRDWKEFIPQPPKRSARLWLPLAAAVVLLAAILAWWLVRGRAELLAPAWLEFAPPEQVTATGNVKLAAISPNGAYLAYTTRDGDRETLRIRTLATKQESSFSPFSDRSFGLTFSPDSRSLYYVLKDQREWGRLYSVSLSSSIPKLVLEDIDGAITFSPDGKQFAFMRRSDQKRTSLESIVVAQAADTGDQRIIVAKSSTLVDSSLAWSPAGDSIAAVVYSVGLHNSLRPTVFLFSPAGAVKGMFSDPSLRKLNCPVWLNRGSLLVLVGVVQGATDPQARLYEVSVPTAHFRPLFSTGIVRDSVSASRAGNLLAAVRLTHASSLWIADAKHLSAISQYPTGTESLESLTWSANGEIVFPSARTSNVNLWRATASGYGPLASPQNCVEEQPASVPRSSLIVYSSNCATGGADFNLWQLDATTGQRRQLTSGSNIDQHPNITPDGRWIVYTSWPSNVPSLWKIPVGGGTPVPISHPQARSPAVSPDGRSIACQVRENYDGRWRVAILSLADGSLQREFPQLPTDSVVRWSPDSLSLDYIDAKSGSSNLWRQPLNGGRARQLTRFSSKEEIQDFAWSLNGDKLAYIQGHAESDVILYHHN
jgi:eukaryotic-like serine/threonine-protein kinase